MRTNEKIKSSYITQPKKRTDTDTSAYDRVLRALKKPDTLYYINMLKTHEPIIEGKDKVTRYTRVIMISVEHK